MDLFVNKNLLKSILPLKQLQRYRGKINIQRPRKPHYERAKLWQFCEPKYLPKQTVNCTNLKNKKLFTVEENPYEKIIAKDCMNWFMSSKMVAFFHLNSIKAEDLLAYEIKLKKSNMYFKCYGKKVLQLAFNNNEYKAILPLFCSKTAIVFSPDEQVNQLVKLTRRIQQFILLGGIVDDRFLSRESFINFGQLPDLQTSRALFVQTLNLFGNQIVQNLNCHQNTLVQHLESHIKQNLQQNTENVQDDISKQNSET